MIELSLSLLALHQSKIVHNAINLQNLYYKNKTLLLGTPCFRRIERNNIKKCNK